jgi:6-phosphogluconolactonase
MTLRFARFLIAAALLGPFLPAAPQQAGGKGASDPEWIAYVGTYTGPKSQGIYSFRFEAATGKMTPIALAAVTSNPTFLAVHPNRRYLYAVNEDAAGKVSAFAIEGSGRLKLLNQVSAKGAGPCHLAIDRDGKWLLIANYDSGSVASFPIQADGTLGEAVSFVQHTGHSVMPTGRRSRTLIP